MKKFFLYLLIILGALGGNEFLVERKICSAKEAQEKLCSLRVDIMRLITDVQSKMARVQHQLASAHSEFQEDFFSFATGEKKTLLSSKDKQLLNKKVQEAFALKENLIQIQAGVELFLK